MFSRRALISVAITLSLSLTSITAISNASELSDAQLRYLELQSIYATNLEAVNGWLPKSETDSQACIDRLAGATSVEDISSRQTCQDALRRFQAYKVTLKNELEQIKVELAGLEAKFPTLKQTNTVGTPPISGGTSIPSGGSTSPTVQVTPTPLSSVTPQVSPTPNATSSPSPIPIPIPSAIPSANAPTQLAATPATSTSPESVTAATTSKSPTPTPKATAKKRTITCVKGKTIRKVTAVNPVCPKGFKVQRRGN